MITVCLLDFDGTLCNTLPDLVTVLNLTRNEFSLPPMTTEDVLREVNLPLRDYLRRLTPELATEEEHEKSVLIYQDFYAVHGCEKTAPYDGMVDMLLKLKKDGVKLGVLSNKDNRSVRDLTEKLFPGIFDCVWGVTSDVKPKPDPERINLIAAEYGVKPETMCLVGDSDVDMITAVNGKVVPIGVRWGYRSPEMLIKNGAKYTPNDTKELYEIIKSI